MRWSGSCVAVLACLCVSSGLEHAQAADAGQDMPPPVITEKTRIYTQDDVKKSRYDGFAYPQRATNDGIEGVSEISCEIAPDGGFSRCVILKETPAGYWFGETQALMALRDYKLAIPAGMKVPPGYWKRLRFVWKFG